MSATAEALLVWARRTLLDAMPPDAVPPGADVATIVHTAAGRLRSGQAARDSIRRLHAQWAQELTEAMEYDPDPDPRVVAVRDALLWPEPAQARPTRRSA